MIYQEFCDQNMHRSFPLKDESPGEDISGSFKLPTSLITDLYMCVPNIPQIDVEKFYIHYIIARRAHIDIAIGYDDPSTPEPIGVFKNILVNTSLQQAYIFTPSRVQLTGPLAALYICTGQIIIGNAAETSTKLGVWRFDPSSTYISPTRIARGLINVQYLAIGDRLLSGTIIFKEGANVSLDVQSSGDESIITIDVTPNVNSTTINSDQDVIDALTNELGVPIRSINGLLPDLTRNFEVLAADCTEIINQAAGITIGNPCATPCCPEDPNIAAIKESITALNLRYSQLQRAYDATRDIINDVQNKLLSLGNTL
jgi:hypothetical protein